MARFSISMGRSLTAGEMEHLRPLFGAAVAYERVRIHRGADGNLVALIAFGFGNRAIALGRHIHVETAGYRDDYHPHEPSGLAAFGDFVVHEMVHVWQWGCGRFNPVRYLWQYLTWPHRGYDVRSVTPEHRFEALGYDQQAEVARLWFVASRGEGAEWDAERLGPVLRRVFPGKF